jgi:hypothetical protein
MEMKGRYAVYPPYDGRGKRQETSLGWIGSHDTDAMETRSRLYDILFCSDSRISQGSSDSLPCKNTSTTV